MNEMKYPVLLRSATPSTMTLSKHNKSNWIDTLRSIRHCRTNSHSNRTYFHSFVSHRRRRWVWGECVKHFDSSVQCVSLFFSVFFFYLIKFITFPKANISDILTLTLQSPIFILKCITTPRSTFCRQQFRFLSFSPSAIEMPANKILFQHNFDFDFHMAAATTAAANKT